MALPGSTDSRIQKAAERAHEDADLTQGLLREILKELRNLVKLLESRELTRT